MVHIQQIVLITSLNLPLLIDCFIVDNDIFYIVFVCLCVIIGNEIDILCACVVISRNSCESLGYKLCQVIEDLNHAHAHGHLRVVGSFVFKFEIFKLFLDKFVLDFSSFLFQQYICGIDLINVLHQHLAPFLYCFRHA
jgi:hypothetical protein